MVSNIWRYRKNSRTKSKYDSDELRTARAVSTPKRGIIYVIFDKLTTPK